MDFVQHHFPERIDTAAVRYADVALSQQITEAPSLWQPAQIGDMVSLKTLPPSHCRSPETEKPRGEHCPCARLGAALD